LRLPPEQASIVVVQGTGGDGLWLRREPAGQPVQTQPDGTPLLVSGADQEAGGRTWRHVWTFDGGSGWAAADYLTPADPTVLAAALATVNGSGGPPGSAASRPGSPTGGSTAPLATPPPPTVTLVASPPARTGMP
jgi:hypothetical protein